MSSFVFLLTQTHKPQTQTKEILSIRMWKMVILVTAISLVIKLVKQFSNWRISVRQKGI